MKKDTQNLLAFAALGIGAYYLITRSASSAAPASSSAATALARAPRPFGDPTDRNSVAYACNAAYRLTSVGRTREAASWIPTCTAGGGTVPTTASQQYT